MDNECIFLLHGSAMQRQNITEREDKIVVPIFFKGAVFLVQSWGRRSHDRMVPVQSVPI